MKQITLEILWPKCDSCDGGSKFIICACCKNMLGVA